MSETPKRALTRRLVLGGAALAVIGVAGWRAGWLRALWPEPALPFQAMTNPAGFRILKGGAITAGGVPLFGLDRAKPAGLIAAQATIADDLCSALFGAGAADANVVQMAYFFDYQCPICRRLTPRLRALKGVDIEWHDLSGLGPASETAARAAIAAGQQGAYDAFHDRLMRARFQPNEGYVASLAQSIGIDADRLQRDMFSELTDTRLWLSRALATSLGMVGTPGLVIGHSVIIGDVSNRDMARIIAEETGQPACA
jgi:protein-disulfide isomerase